MVPKARYREMNDPVIEPQNFSMGLQRRWRKKKKPPAKPQTTKRMIATRSSSASISDECNRHDYGLQHAVFKSGEAVISMTWVAGPNRLEPADLLRRHRLTPKI